MNCFISDTTGDFQQSTQICFVKPIQFLPIRTLLVTLLAEIDRRCLFIGGFDRWRVS